MIKRIELVLLPQEAANKQLQMEQAAEMTATDIGEISHLQIIKRSIDARSRVVRIRMMADVYINESPPEPVDLKKHFSFSKNIANAKEVMIAGCGPAGMFAALRLIELGYKPVIIEQGQAVRERRRSLAAINKEGIVNPHSNYCFGEGGAGTYSDGKLYTRSGKRGDINRVLQLLVLHGADEDILVNAHPHIGTNKLPQVVEAIRKTIIDCGGEIFFNTSLHDMQLHQKKIKSVLLKNVVKGSIEEKNIDALILATGHSARNIFYLLNEKGIAIEAKPFALGVRIEHPQNIIDQVQYHCSIRPDALPPASYSLVHQSKDRGVYSFCMCPGGIIAPASTDVKEIVVNGWSPSKRNNPYANSGMVVSVDERDFSKFNHHKELRALKFQEEIEQRCFEVASQSIKAPAQRMIDFIQGKQSSTLPDNSYLPGLTSAKLSDALPIEISTALKDALKTFSKKMQGYYTNEAVLVATESRTSSPVRIPRDKETLQHTDVKGLFPCGEGAGYAGGIVSAAIDGERCAEAAIKSFQ